MQQTGPSGTISLTGSCQNSAGMSFTPSSVAIGGTTATAIFVTALAAPNPAVTSGHACTITIMGGGGQTAQVGVDITSTTIGVQGGKRR
ncbi:MAG TPA: hypothetical protein VK665_03335 [Candidatus Elarobacter sp.]|nr:hypothetical protein [Candidatus Elarobacter sp.]